MLHRLSGIGAFLGISVLSWWLILCVLSDFNIHIVSLYGSLWFKLMLYLLVFGLCIHCCTGIRHLIWDMGYGFSIKHINLSGVIVVVTAMIMFLVWICGFLL